MNDDMGARSQVAGLVGAATVALILVFLTEPIQYLPKAVLGAVIVFAAVGLVDPAAWRALAATPTSWLVLDAEAVTQVDATGLEALLDLTEDLRRDGIALALARLRTRMEADLREAGVLDAIGRDRLYPTVRAAVEACASPGAG